LEKPLFSRIEEILGEKFGKKKIKNSSDRKEAVEIEASIKDAKISNLSKVNHIKLLDVNNLSMGVNAQGNIMSKIIPRSTPTHISSKEFYKTVKDNQTTALIEVFEEEDNDTSKNLFLGDFEILLPKKKAGEAKISVMLEIDDLSLLKVTATEKENENNSIEKIYFYDANYEQISNNLKIIEPKNIGQIVDKIKMNNT